MSASYPTQMVHDAEPGSGWSWGPPPISGQHLIIWSLASLTFSPNFFMIQVTPRVLFWVLLMLNVLHLYEQFHIRGLCAVVGGVGGQGCGLQKVGHLLPGKLNGSSDCAHRFTWNLYWDRETMGLMKGHQPERRDSGSRNRVGFPGGTVAKTLPSN